MLRPLPKLDDAAAMAKLGRLSAIRSARLDASHGLRDCVTRLQRDDLPADEWEETVQQARACLDRIAEIQKLLDMP